MHGKWFLLPYRVAYVFGICLSIRLWEAHFSEQ